MSSFALRLTVAAGRRRIASPAWAHQQLRNLKGAKLKFGDSVEKSWFGSSDFGSDLNRYA